ncbi:MAG: co-chaperone GroES [Tyzzerella sp.]|uniref:Co-chaperonin GroES n=1 Tax=Candidatus Fimicola merdigallinarum TaxID=2840819 RepID=A0A9D9DYJ4_9FIRM|nr:co-chaperone GroES [Candidatus Fimicola merdigallinarum]
MKLVPLGDKVIIKQVEAEEKTKGGLILTTQSKEKPQIAEVIAVGPGGEVNGHDVKMTVKVGDKVIYTKYAGTEVKFEGEEYIVLRQNDILAIIED